MEKSKAEEIVNENNNKYSGQRRKDRSNGNEYTIYKLYVQKFSENDYMVLCDLGQGKWIHFNDIERGSDQII